MEKNQKNGGEEKACHLCKYFNVQEEYWHDHYRIPAHMYCSYHARYNEHEVKSDDCCENFERRIV